ncbi:hypothetical protein B0T16DRAFT_147227 [Cercophora newfieldiana]|uniref:Nephrocystin 3-like N-terminal domain-containing protein n=1 Tax=Cercophora newfieldiana TaxID=92897 RepID=A0AA40CPC5_9PEZI|nr:hypothetical protein B0T16DRAFT_147227 [Cercophora newfieldiana]
MAINNIHPNADAYSTLEHFHPEDKTARARADIVLVAGLGGDHIKSWQAPDGCAWPWDLLPKHVPGIRVLSFRYNTSISGTTSKAGIRQHAKDLLWKLRDDREDDEAATLRPIIFIGHSLGGTIIKQAVRLARSEPSFKSLFDASRGIMFFATPQWRMDESAWPIFTERVLRRNAPEASINPTDMMVKEVQLNSSTLSKVSEDFKAVQKQLVYESFLEDVPMDGAHQVFVTGDQGLIHDIDREQHSYMSGDHLALCKFGHADGDRFRPVYTGVERLISSTPKPIDELSPQERKAHYLLCPQGFHCYSLDKEPAPGTCTWILQRPEFTEWVDGQPGRHKLWLHSQPGAGKSFLAKYIITALSSEPLEAIHCFLSNSTPGRGDLEALMRATLHQALRLEPHVIRDILPQKSQDLHLSPKMWTQDLLMKHWPNAMAKIAARHSLALVVDGLDELRDECKMGFLHCLQQFEKNMERLEFDSPALDDDAGPKSPRFRILLLSRESPEVGVQLAKSGFNQYPVTSKDTGEDIKSTVSMRLGKILGFLGNPNKPPATAREDPCAIIAKRSGGCYSWAILVVEYLSRVPMTRETDVVWLVRQLPYDVQDFYRLILENLLLKPEVAKLFVHVIRWALFQNAPLKSIEFNIAYALGVMIEPDLQDFEDAKKVDVLLRDIRRFENSLDDNIKIRVEVYCGQVVKFQDERLELAHGCLRSILLTDGAELSGGVGFGLGNRALHLILADSHAILADICIAYLNMAYFEDSGVAPTPTTMDAWESKVRRRIKSHAFVRYAALNWHKHMASAGRTWPRASAKGSSMKLKRRLVDENTEYAKSWAEVWWFCTKGPTVEYPSKCPASWICAHDSTQTGAASPKQESSAIIVSAPESTRDVPSATNTGDGTLQAVDEKQNPTPERRDSPMETPPRESSQENTLLILTKGPERTPQEIALAKEVPKEASARERRPEDLVLAKPKDQSPTVDEVQGVQGTSVSDNAEKPSGRHITARVQEQTLTPERSPLSQDAVMKRLPQVQTPDLVPQQVIPKRKSSHQHHVRLLPEGELSEAPPRPNSIKPTPIPERRPRKELPSAEPDKQAEIPPARTTPVDAEKTDKSLPQTKSREETTGKLPQSTSPSVSIPNQTDSWWGRVKKAGRGLVKEVLSTN